MSTADRWGQYVPSKQSPWDLRRVVHLHRRAGFAATWDEIQRDLRDGPEASVERVLSGKGFNDKLRQAFERTSALMTEAAVTSHDDAQRLKAWWLYRMLFGPDPLGERLTFLWHNHFATSNLKVQNVEVMRAQNAIFRAMARAPFGRLLDRVGHDAALLLWLDAPANRKEHPNENLARELMELFTLGIGHYTETDVKEAARALTGWTLGSDGSFRDVAARHDTGEKTILGHTGRWRGEDLVKMLVKHPATAQRLAWRICQLLMGEGAVTDAHLKTLAEGLRQHDLDIGWAVGTVLRSEAFFAAGNLGNQVVGPVEFVVSSVRALGLSEAPPNTPLMAESAARLGQDLFYPPNVGGWPGGRNWISPQSMIIRANYASALVQGNLNRPGKPFDALGLAQRYGSGGNLDQALQFYGKLLFGTELGAGLRRRLTATIGPKPADLAAATRHALILILASPEYQLA
jgi:uncharacterized protein (DUF1800 family)